MDENNSNLEIKVFGVHNVAKGKWVVDYSTPMACGCGYKPRVTLIIEQKNKPATRTIENAIRNQGK